MDIILKDDNKLKVFSDRLFQTYDSNKNNFIENDEFYNLIMKFSQEQQVDYVPSKEEIKELFNQLDKDKSHKLDAKEFKEFTKSLILEILKRNEEKKKK